MKLAHSGSHASAHTASAERAVGSFQLFYKVGGGSNGHMLATISHGINRPSRVDSGDTWMSHSLPLRLDLNRGKRALTFRLEQASNGSIPVVYGPPTQCECNRSRISFAPFRRRLPGAGLGPNPFTTSSLEGGLHRSSSGWFLQFHRPALPL